MTATPRRDPVTRLLTSAQDDLRWASSRLSAAAAMEDCLLAQTLSVHADRIPDALAGDPDSRVTLLTDIERDMREAAGILRNDGDRDTRHRANNLMQSVENAQFVLERMTRLAA